MSSFINRIRVSSIFLVLLLLLGCSGPPEGQDKANKGVESYKTGDYQQAVDQLNAGLKAGVYQSQESDLWTILGNSYDELDEYEKAIEAHKKALEVDPEAYKAWTNLGAAYRHSKNYEDARKSYQKALELNPDYPEAHASLGALYIFENEPKLAVESLEKALELDDSLPVSHANIAVAYAKLGRFKDARKSLAKANSLGYQNGDVIEGLIEDEKKARNG